MKATDFQISSKSLTIEDAYSTKKEKAKDKTIYTKSRQSSDLTEFSFNISETFSQTSENIFIPCELKSNSKSYKKSEEPSCINYYSGIENYFRIIEPKKFYEYKYTRNYLPKESQEEKNEFSQSERPKANINNNINTMSYPNYENKYDNNEMNMNNNYLFQIAQNYYQNLFSGNLIYNIYNNFFLNYPFPFTVQKEANDANSKTKEDIPNKTASIKNEEKKDKIKEKETSQEKKEKKNDIEIIYVNNKKDRYEERFNRHNNRNRKENHYYNDYDYKRRCMNFEYNNKFNGNFNFEKNRKKFHGENNFYKRKFFQQNYY